MGERRRDRKQRKLTIQQTNAIYMTAQVDQALQAQHLELQRQQLELQRRIHADALAKEPQWHPDPMGRHEMRYWDGQAWTANVSDQGITSQDPV